MITYRTIPGAPADRLYFECKPLSATLSVEACATNWRRAHEGEGARSWHCKGCKLGALHAGETAANLWQGQGQLICSRCHSGCTRLIKGWVCVSCYNREREYRLGANARGGFPVKMTPLVPRQVMVHDRDGRRLVARAYTHDTTELMVGTLRDSRSRVTFSFWGGQVAAMPQKPLF